MADLGPIDCGENMLVIVEFDPFAAAAMRYLRQEYLAPPVPISPTHRQQPLFAAIARCYLVAESAEACLFEAGLDLLDCFADIGVPTVYVALVQPFAARAPCMRLPHYAAYELRDRTLRFRVVQHHEQICERAIPAFHQGRFGNDPLDRRVFREQIFAAELVQVR